MFFWIVAPDTHRRFFSQVRGGKGVPTSGRNKPMGMELIGCDTIVICEVLIVFLVMMPCFLPGENINL